MPLRYPVVALAVLTAFPALAQSPSDVADLVGARGAGGEAQLQARGYVFVRTETGDDRKWSYWWHPQRRQCISVATVDGRYQAITATPAPDCGHAAEAGAGHGHSGHPPVPSVSSAPIPARPEVGGQPVDIGLVCFGDGERPSVANRSGWTWDFETGRYVFGNRVEMTAQHFDTSVTIQLWNGGGRIKLPSGLVPPIHSGGTDGWWELTGATVGDDAIRGQYRLNGLNKPRLTIDRRSGRISIVGTSPYRFSGTCDTIDHADRRRF